MLEAANIRMSSALRRFFATILVSCELIGVRDLWNEFYLHMVDDYPSSSITTDVVRTNRLLNDLKLLLSQHGIRITEFDLTIITARSDESSSMPKIIQDELIIPMDDEELTLVDKLNNDQKFLSRALLASLRSDGHIAIATATSGIATTLLPGGRTAHSKFKIPLIPEASSTCSTSKQSDLAELIRRAVVLIWDEAPMVLILGGDFRQVLPVVPKGTKAELLNACIVNSPLWRYIKILHLTQNMRSINDQQFSEYIRRIDLQNHAYNARYMVDRALLTPINEDVDKLNEKIITQFPGEEQKLYLFDEVEDDTQHLYQQDFLNSISPGGLPPHILRLKKGAPIMLLRNIDPKVGLCNGTRLLCHGCFNNVIDAEILTGQYAGTRVFLPRIPLKTTENVHLPFVMIRRQFPIRLSFALTINKAQGQTIPNVGIYLPDHVFSHGQLMGQNSLHGSVYLENKHLTMSDMATLAIKVSVALQRASSKDGHLYKKACILAVNKSVSLENYNKINNGFEYSNYGYGPNDTNKTLVIYAKRPGVVGAGGLA
ncbi:hypothetical protein SO802_028937 [Lithocarpus litseifolius]|uniref:ATP-dependent DNA helicase n=1 Tax=Lithocarpus litseifolius TaxID=425828 RepID=A0AAW2BTL6_9ROSI